LFACAAALLVSAAVGTVLRAQDPVMEIARRAAAESLRPGDMIQLQFTQERDLNSSIVVNDRGEAIFPKLGALSVANITIGALPDTLRSRYAMFLRRPELDVAVLRRVTVNGEVRLPNVYMLDVNSTVRDAIAKAGGLIETSKKSSVVIVRGGEQIRVPDWEHNIGPLADLRSGDQVIVGRKSWLTLNALPLISTSVIVIGLIRSLRN
jgi:polysaccharide biosynthesis/export protein